jgi:dTDP-4-dehydrorhamnose 3,5-epimerase-like enzyme
LTRTITYCYKKSVNPGRLNLAHYLQFRTVTDARGNLTVVEREIPFDIKRIYYIYGVPGESVRGQHRHYKTIHALICLKGSLEVYVNDGKRKETFVLDRPDQGLILPPEDWHSMYSFGEDTILLVLASEYYDPAEYIAEEYP